MLQIVLVPILAIFIFAVMVVFMLELFIKNNEAKSKFVRKMVNFSYILAGCYMEIVVVL